MTKPIAEKQKKIYLAGILALGAVLRLWRLGSQSFWWDEVYSANLSIRSLSEVIPRFGQTPTLYHVLLHFWLYLGHGDTYIRLLSALFGIAFLWVIYLLGKTLLDERHGLLCAFLLAISPFHLWYSQEARMYSLLTLLSATAMLFFIKFLNEGKGRSALFWVISSGLAVYTHYYAAFVLGAQFLFVLLYWPRYRSRWPHLVWAIAAQVVVLLPIFLLFFFGERYAAVCAQGAGGNPLRLFSFPYTFFAFSLGFSYGPSIYELHRATTLSTVQPYMIQILPAFVMFSAIFALGLRSLWRKRERLVLVLFYLLVPIAGASLISLILPQVSYNVRYVSIALPAYGMILTCGLLALRKKLLFWVLLILLLAVTSVSIYNHFYLGKFAKEDYRSAVQFIDDFSEEGDVILTPHMAPFSYYYRGSLRARSLFWTPKYYRRIIHRQMRGHQRAWVILSREWGVDPEGEMRDYMREIFPIVTETTFSNLYLGLFDVPARQKR